MKSFNVLMLATVLMVGACSTRGGGTTEVFNDTMEGVVSLHVGSVNGAKFADYDDTKKELTIASFGEWVDGTYKLGSISAGPTATFELTDKPDLVMSITDDTKALLQQTVTVMGKTTKLSMTVYFKK